MNKQIVGVIFVYLLTPVEVADSVENEDPNSYREDGMIYVYIYFYLNLYIYHLNLESGRLNNKAYPINKPT